MRASSATLICLALMQVCRADYAVCAEADPAGIALLRGAELARTRHASLRASVDLRWIFSSDGTTRVKTARCEIEMNGNMLRSEVIPGNGGFDATVVIRDGDDFRAFRRRNHANLDVYDVKRAVSVRGDIAFDPRVLGLSDLMSASTTVRHTLHYDEYENISVVGKELVRGVHTWRVIANHNDATFQFWIEEPSFRVHRKSVHWEVPVPTRIEIDSEFNSPDIPAPFPSRVVAVRSSPDSRQERIYEIKKLDLGVSIPSDRFTLNSMALPINTPVNDYRISRIVGYWDGEKVAPRPVSLAPRNARPQEGATVQTSPKRYLLRLGIGFGILAAAIYVVWFFQRRPAHQ